MSTSKLLSEHREPWADDFDSFRESISNDLPSPTETQQILLASSRSDLKPRKENKLMSLMRQKPLVSAAVLVLAMLILAPAAYAVVNKLFLTVDTQQSEEEIKDSIEEQLTAAGLPEADVDVEKEGGSTRVLIGSEDEDAYCDLRAEDIQVTLGGEAEDTQAIRLGVGVACNLSEEHRQALYDLVEGEACASLGKRREELGDEAYATALEEFFGENGFTNVDAHVEGDRIVVTFRGSTAE
jgi:hypothetical protein